ncbi:MAG: dihydrodipicolinate synthase family protein [Sulfolobales archaeon]|nr:dihydrodipicolinate synthase family protein [Sulfolobales archaeon]MCX8185983.1 dihydrodipicolinate synthase family protein [Sulfolobales archaeon]MDW7969240.1 dihydrodipicolinate synthase family protein [Sulfolobales archaeon]
MNLNTVITALITPFTKNFTLYLEGLMNLVDFQMGNGVKAFFICGTYGSGPLMSVAERKKVAEALISYVGGKATVIVHVGANNVDDTLDLARHAESIGADAIASVPPYYYVYDDAAILNYFSKLVSEVKIPVFLYNNPARTGVKISSELVRRLSEVGVVGVKDSSFDLVRFYEDMAVVDGKDFKFIIGTEALMLPAIMAGAMTAVSGLSNTFPELVVKLYNLIKMGMYSEAVKVQLDVIKVRRVLHLVPTIPAVYEVLRMRGIDVGYPKPPLRTLNTKEVELIRDGLMRIGMLR